jgi:hypothetical protein
LAHAGLRFGALFLSSNRIGGLDLEKAYAQEYAAHLSQLLWADTVEIEKVASKELVCAAALFLAKHFVISTRIEPQKCLLCDLVVSMAGVNNFLRVWVRWQVLSLGP